KLASRKLLEEMLPEKKTSGLFFVEQYSERACLSLFSREERWNNKQSYFSNLIKLLDRISSSNIEKLFSDIISNIGKSLISGFANWFNLPILSSIKAIFISIYKI